MSAVRKLGTDVLLPSALTTGRIYEVLTQKETTDMPTDVLRKLDNRVRRPLWTRRLKNCVQGDDSGVVRLGTAHGGWALPEASIRSGATAVCVGAGEDVSFDV